MTSYDHVWLPRAPPDNGNALAVFCFPHAGARWTCFRDWADEVPSSVAIIPVDYPRRSSDGTIPFANAVELAQASYEALRRYQHQPMALLGHSLGAIVAFELAKLMSSDGFGPTALIVSGRAAPDSPPQDVPVHALPTPALWSRVASWGGLQDAIGSDPITREFFELILRADLRLAETYQPSPAKRLACPILGVAGLSDPLAPPQTMYRWREVTTGRVAIETLPGTHFFPFTHRPQFLRLVSRALEEA